MNFIQDYIVYIVLAGLAMSCYGEQASTPCSTLDVAFILDSGNIKSHNYELLKQFIDNTAYLLHIPNNNHGAVVIFGSEGEIDITFNLAIKVIFLSKKTFRDKALLLAPEDVFPNARKNASKIALILMNGKQHRDALKQASQSLRKMDVRVIAVGIDNDDDYKELKSMVLYPNDVMYASDFTCLEEKAKFISQYLCNISRSTSASPSCTDCKSSSPLVTAFLEKLKILDYQDFHSIQNATNLLANLILESQNKVKSVSSSDVMYLVRAIEGFSFNWTEHFFNSSSSSNISFETNHAVFQAQSIRSNTTEDYIFPSKDVNKHGTSVILPKDVFKKNGGIVISILFKELHDYLKKISSNLTKKELGTKIVSVSVKQKTTPLDVKNVTLRFKTYPASNRYVKPNCVFWDYAQFVGRNSGWSSEGCTLVKTESKIVECTCNHLTNFAVLMEIEEQTISPPNQVALSVITYFGIGVSLIGCLLTLALHFAFVNVRTQLWQIHINLVISMAIAQIIFIAGINATENLIGCACVAALIQYFYLVAFCWMLVEGIQLYLRIVKVFNFEHGMLVVYIFAWGIPLLIVVGTVAGSTTTREGLRGFVHTKFCWLSFKNKLAWTFVGPVLAITLVNIILLLQVIREMSRMDKAMVGLTPQLESIRKTAKACAVLFPLLGVTWMFGVLTISEVGVAAQYIFTILNSTQGFLIFLLNCVRNSEIRSKVKAKIYSFYHPKTPSTIVPSPNPLAICTQETGKKSTDRKHQTESQMKAQVTTKCENVFYKTKSAIPKGCSNNLAVMQTSQNKQTISHSQKRTCILEKSENNKNSPKPPQLPKGPGNKVASTASKKNQTKLPNKAQQVSSKNMKITKQTEPCKKQVNKKDFQDKSAKKANNKKHSSS